jgi:hypothetical protein
MRFDRLGALIQPTIKAAADQKLTADSKSRRRRVMHDFSDYDRKWRRPQKYEQVRLFGDFVVDKRHSAGRKILALNLAEFRAARHFRIAIWSNQQFARKRLPRLPAPVATVRIALRVQHLLHERVKSCIGFALRGHWAICSEYGNQLGLLVL